MDRQDNLLTALYGSVLEPDDVHSALMRINRWLDCDGAYLVGWNKTGGSVVTSMVIADELHHGEGPYKAYYHSIDPRRAYMEVKKNAPFTACHHHFDQRYVNRSEFYQDFVIPHGLRYIMGGNIFHSEDRDIFIAFNHVAGRPEFSREKLARASALQAHLTKWSAMMMHADALRGALSAGSNALEALDQGVIALNQRLQVIFANSEAQSILGPGLVRAGLGLQLIEGPNFYQRLRRVDLTRVSETFTAVQTRQNESTRCLVSILAIAREGSANHMLPVGMQGMSSVEQLPGTEEGLFDGLVRPNLVVLVCKSEGANPIESEHLRQLFGLTPAESKLAAALAKGMSTRDYGDNNHVSINTIRTQIRALLAKTGAGNLRALVGMLARLPKMSTKP